MSTIIIAMVTALMATPAAAEYLFSPWGGLQAKP